PLISKSEPCPEYPVEALGDVLGNTALKISDCVQVPKALAGQSILSVAALVAQSFNNVRFDSMTCPVSLFCLTVAESGDRKSSADRFALKPVVDWQREKLKEYAEQEKQYRIDLKAYKTSEQALINANKKRSQVELSQKLSQLVEPTPPVNPKIISREPTLEGLQKGFQSGNPSQGLFNDEAGQFFGGHAMNKDNLLKTAAGLSKLWDGDAIDRTRAGDGENIYLENRRLSAHLMIQPVISNEILTDKVLLGQGFIARYLIAYPESLAGTRLYKQSDLSSDPYFLNYCELITGLLNRNASTDEDGNLILNDISPSGEARAVWIDAYNRIERQLGKDGELPHIKPTAAKAAENMLRIAGVFATIEDTPEITLEQMQRAILLGRYYLKSFLWIVDKGQENKLMVQANDLLEWVKTNIDKDGLININLIGKKAPRGTGARNVKQARRLMNVLESNGYLVIMERNTKGDPTEWKIINFNQGGGNGGLAESVDITGY
ncbi:MAG TPA: DUF3987 domain-containing protein, partial [Aeromonadales bacterium]|nr:DUF3987 domain-containing protein [Aeromonadales bacterium]